MIDVVHSKPTKNFEIGGAVCVFFFTVATTIMVVGTTAPIMCTLGTFNISYNTTIMSICPWKQIYSHEGK